MADGAGSPSQLRNTYDRFSGVVPEENILVVTLSRFADQARKVLPGIKQENLLLEPFARKTAPCMALAADTLLNRDPEAVMVATPWDLVIRDEVLFARTIEEAFEYVENNDVLMTLGIVERHTTGLPLDTGLNVLGLDDDGRAVGDSKLGLCGLVDHNQALLLGQLRLGRRLHTDNIIIHHLQTHHTGTVGLDLPDGDGHLLSIDHVVGSHQQDCSHGQCARHHCSHCFH